MQVQEIIAILHKWGIRTLGRLAALDKEQLGARLGPEAVRMWERANGQSNRMLKLIRPPESFEESFEFEHEIETAEPLLFMLRRFLEQLAVRLSAIYLVAKELTLRITFSNSRQVTALLGSDRIGTPILEETHRPDAFRMEAFGSTGFQSATGRTRRGEPVGQAGVPACKRNGRLAAASPFRGRQDVPLPHSQDGCAPLRAALRRFRPPVTASILRDENKPAHVCSVEIQGKIVEQRGPYLLSGNWWSEKSWARAEWDVQLGAGELVRCHESEGIWKVDGVYD